MAAKYDSGNASELSDVESTTSSDSDVDNTDSGEPEKVEWLATTRAKRSTAGNRMKSMLANEEPAAEDSDLELLFAEDEDDVGFSDDAKDDASDVQMDSSSDDEDQDEAADDLEGEKELERQAREKRNAQRKRKAQEAIPAKFRKKVRIDESATAADSASPRSTAPPPPSRPPPRPKKKSERMSWLPSVSDMPVRASERHTTKVSKQQLHQKMVKDEVRRKKQLERMEKNAKRLEALKKPPMTQAERLQEAALVEKRNSKSLNRWEVAEKQREEERLRKIAALNNRKLDGPVITFWTGIQELEEGQLKHVGNLVSIEEKAPRKKRQSAAAALANKDPETAKAEDASKPTSPTENAGAKLAEAAPGIKPEVPEVPEPPSLPTTVPPASEQSPQTIPPQENMNKPEETQSAVAPDGTPTPAPVPPPPPVPALVPNSVPAPAPVPVPVQAPAPAAIAPVPALATAPPPPLPPPPVQDPAPSQSPMAPPPVPPLPDAKQPPSAVLAAPILAPPVGVAAPLLSSRMSMLGFSASTGKSNCLAPPNTTHTPSPLSLPPTTPGSGDLVAPNAAPGAPVASATPSPSTLTPPPPPPLTTALQPTQGKSSPAPKGPDTPQEAASEPPREGKVTRSCIILQNFDENAIKDRQVQTQILFGRKMNKLAKPAHAPLCVITNRPAKYRDPKTGLPFDNCNAYKAIQRVSHGDYRYSRLLGAYVGSEDLAAKGVPERFLDPSKPRSTTKAAPAPEKTEQPVPVSKEVDTKAPDQILSQDPAKIVTEARLLPIEDVKMEGDAAAATVPIAAPITQPGAL